MPVAVRQGIGGTKMNLRSLSSGAVGNRRCELREQAVGGTGRGVVL